MLLSVISDFFFWISIAVLSLLDASFLFTWIFISSHWGWLSFALGLILVIAGLMVARFGKARASGRAATLSLCGVFLFGLVFLAGWRITNLAGRWVGVVFVGVPLTFLIVALWRTYVKHR